MSDNIDLMTIDAKLETVIAKLAAIERRLGKSLMAASAVGFAGGDQSFGPVTYAQHGEDLIVANIFALIGIEKPSYLDIGAHHPLRDSNTALMHRIGSRGINIEANPDLIGEFHRLRPDDVSLNVGVAQQPGVLEFYRIDRFSGRNTFDRATAEAFVKAHPRFSIQDVLKIEVRTLTDIVQHYAAGIYPDFLTIDIEGLDFDVLASIDLAGSRPKVICVECLSGDERDDTARLNQLLSSRGYVALIRTVSNLIFVDETTHAALRLPGS